jgi:hypothetical protein
VFDKDAGQAPVLPKNTLAIAKNPTHFYGPPSFRQNNLYVQVGNLKKLVQDLVDLGIKIENLSAESSKLVASNIPCADALSPEDAAMDAHHRLVGAITLLALLATIYSTRHSASIVSTFKRWTFIINPLNLIHLAV